MNLCYTYGGIVEDNQDPMKIGRMKVRVPHVYGSNITGSGYIGVNDLPWALPAGMPAGGTHASGGFSQLPAVGDKVFVRFLDGEPEKPIWEWGSQSNNDADGLKLHEYATGTPVGTPDRAIITRYGHSLEITETKVILTTQQGYQLVLNTSASETGGSVALQTPIGQKLELNDVTKSAVIQTIGTAVISGDSTILSASSDSMIRAGGTISLLAGGGAFTIQNDGTTKITTASGAALLIDADGNVAMLASDGTSVSVEPGKVQLASPAYSTSLILEEGKLSITAPQYVLNSSAVSIGAAAEWPVLMLTEMMKIWLLTHTHSSGNNGSPTGPPIVIDPFFPDDTASQTMSTI